MIGIDGYEPVYFEDAAAFRAAHGAFLRTLDGQVLRSGWGIWSAARDEWFADGPLLLLVGDRQVELSAFQLGFAVTCDQIARSAPLRWYVGDGEDDGLGLYWREQSPSPLAEAAGKAVEAVELIECATTIGGGGEGRWVVCGIGLRLGGGYLAVYNALDELGLAAERPVVDRDRRIGPL